MAEIQANTLKELQDFASKHKVVVVDFYATWCGPCVRIGPYVHKKAHETGIALAKVNVDVNTEASVKYAIQAMPTFHVIDTQANSIFSSTGGSEDNVNKVFNKALEHK